MWSELYICQKTGYLQLKKFAMTANILFTTERLKIIKYALPLLDEIYKLYSDDDVVAYTTANGKAKTKEQLVNGIAVYNKMYTNTNNAHGKWLIVNAKNNAVMGYIGLLYIEEIQQTEVSYALMAKYRGNGFASEAAAAMIAYAFTHLQLKQVCALITPDNLPSEKVVKNIGMQYTNTNVSLWGYNFKLYAINNKNSTP